MRTSVYVRLDHDKQRRLAEYARAHELTLNFVVECLIDQLLAQVSPGYEWPEWLVAAVKAGFLPFELPEHCSSSSAPASDTDDRAVVLRAV